MQRMTSAAGRFEVVLCLGIAAAGCGSENGGGAVLGEVVHVAPSVADKSADGSLARPFATLPNAVAAVTAERTWVGTIVAHEGRYELTEELVLPPSADFKVLPGATFALGRDVSLHAQANLQVRGTEAQPITFTWLEEGVHWGALTNFSKTSLDNVVEYAIFEHGGEAQFLGTGVRGALSFADAGGRISNCIFRNNEGDDGLNLKRSPTIVEFSRFENNLGDAIDSDGAAHAEIRDCYFEGNANDAIDLGEGSTAHVHHNVMVGSGDKGVSVGDTSYPTIDHNLIIGCHIGIGIKDSSDPEIRNNTLYACGKGISSYENTTGLGGGKGQFVNGIIWASTLADIEIIDGSPAFSYSCIQGGYEGVGNISEVDGCADPLFVDPANQDFHLKSAAGRWDVATKKWVMDEVTSPGIDAGDPNIPVAYETAPNGNRIDIGAYGGTKEASRSLE